MIETLVKSLESGDVETTMKKKVVKHEKEQASVDDDITTSDKESEKAALE